MQYNDIHRNILFIEVIRQNFTLTVVIRLNKSWNLGGVGRKHVEVNKDPPLDLETSGSIAF